MTYKLFVDDQHDELPLRYPPKGYIAAKSSEQAWQIISALGLPEVMDLDHDLGLDVSGKTDTIRNFLSRIRDEWIGDLPAPPKEVIIHSKNPEAEEWITSFFYSWAKVFGYDRPTIIVRDINS